MLYKYTVVWSDEKKYITPESYTPITLFVGYYFQSNRFLT